MRMKKYKVRLEFHIKETIEVEAKNEKEAKHEALLQIQISAVNAEHYDTQIEEIE